MGDRLITGIIGVISAVIVVAIIAVILAPQSQTAKVLEAAGNSLGGVIKAAVSPVTGSGGAGFTMPSIGNGLFGG